MASAIKGMPKLLQRLTDPDWVRKPTGEFLREWREDLKEEAIDRAPEWRGGILHGLQSNQDTAKFPLWARVFSEAPQARWMEFGTGALSEDPKSSHEPYFPPVERLREWADSKGADPFLIARGIFRAGGTPPTHFFSEAERAADARFNAKLMRFGVAIERDARRGG